MELQLTPALLRLDKKCGNSGIPDNQKCSKKTATPGVVNNGTPVRAATVGTVALGAGVLVGAALLFKKFPFTAKDAADLKNSTLHELSKVSKNVTDTIDEYNVIGSGIDGEVRISPDGKSAFKIVAKPEALKREVYNTIMATKAGVNNARIDAYDVERGIIRMEALVGYKKYNNSLPPEVRKKAAINLVENFKKMHKAGLVHGDIHEGNFMINATGDVKVLDFTRTTKDKKGAFSYELNRIIAMAELQDGIDNTTRMAATKLVNRANMTRTFSSNTYDEVIKLFQKSKLTKIHTDAAAHTPMALVRADKKCGKSGIAKGKKCGKPTSRMQTAAKVALGVGLLTGGAYLAKRRFMSMDEWRNSPLSARNKPKLTAQQAQQISDEAIAGGKVWDVQEKLNARRFQIECGGGLGKISALAKLDAAIRAPRCQAGEGAFGTYFVHPSEKYGIKLFRDAGDDVQWEFDHLDRARYAGVNAPEPLNTNAILDADGEVKAQTLIIGHMKGYKTINDLYHHPYGYATNAPDIVKVKLARQFRKLHTEGLAHGDIHSGNMMAHPRSHKVALIDFGYSTALDDYNPHKNIDGIDNLQQDLRRLPRFLGFEENAADDFIKRHEGVLDNIRTQAQDYNRSWEKYELAIKRYHDALERELLWDERRPRSRFVRSVTQPRIPGMTRRILTANAPTQIREALLIMKPTPFKQVAENLGLAPHRMHLALKPERDALRARQRAQPFGSPIRADKKCGASGIPDGQKCSKRTALRAAVGGALGLTALGVGIAAMTRRKGSIPRPGAPGIGRLAPRPTAGPPGGGGVSRVSVRDITRRPSATLPPTASPRTLALPGSPAPRALLPAAKPRLSKTARMRANTRAAEKLAEGQIAQTAREEIRRIGQIGNTMAATGEAAGMRVKTTVREVRLRLEAARRRFEPGYRAPGDGIKIPKALKASSSRSLPPSATPISSPIPFTPRPQAPERLRLGKTVAQVRQRRSQSGRRQTK